MNHFVKTKRALASTLVASLLIGLWTPAIHSTAYAKAKQDEKEGINYQLDVWEYMKNNVYPNAIKSLKSRNPAIDTSDVQNLESFLTKRARDPSFATDRLFHNMYLELNMKMSTASSGKYKNLEALYGMIKLTPVNPFSRGAYQLGKTISRTINPQKQQQSTTPKATQKATPKATPNPPSDRRSPAYKATVRQQLQKVYTSALALLRQSKVDVSKLPERLDHFLFNVNKDPNYLNTTPGAKTLYTSLNEQSLSMTTNYYGSSTENKPGFLGKIESLGFFTTKEFINSQIDPKSKPPVDPKVSKYDKTSLEYRDSVKRYAESRFIQAMDALKKSSPQYKEEYKRVHNITDLFQQMNKRKNPLDLEQHPKIVRLLNDLNVAVYTASTGAYGKNKQGTFGSYGGFERLFDYNIKLNTGCSVDTVLYGMLGVPSVISINRFIHGWDMQKSVWNAVMFVPTDTLQTCLYALSLAGDGIDLAFISDDQLREAWENAINGVAVGIAIRNILNFVVAVFEKTTITPILTTAVQRAKDVFLVSIKKQPLPKAAPMNVHLSWSDLIRGAMVTLAVSGTVQLNSYVQCDGNAFGSCMTDSQPATVEQWLRKHVSFAMFLGLGVTMWPISDIVFKFIDRGITLFQKAQWEKTLRQAINRGAKTIPAPKGMKTTPSPKPSPRPSSVSSQNPLVALRKMIDDIPIPKPVATLFRNIDQFLNPRKYAYAIVHVPSSTMPVPTNNPSFSTPNTKAYYTVTQQEDVLRYNKFFQTKLESSVINWKKFLQGLVLAFVLPALQYLISQAIINPPTYAKELPKIKTELEVFTENLINLGKDVLNTALWTYMFAFIANFLRKNTATIGKMQAAFAAGKESIQDKRMWLVYASFIVVFGALQYISGIHELVAYTKLDKNNRLTLDSALLSNSSSNRNLAIQLYNNTRAIEVNPLYPIHKSVDPSVGDRINKYQSLLVTQFNLNVTN